MRIGTQGSGRTLPLTHKRKVTKMDKDRIKGSIDQAKGKVKEAAGDLTGDHKLKGEGKADQVAGKVENVVGGVKDKIRETLKD